MAAEKDETVTGGQKGGSSMMLTIVAMAAAFAVALLWRLCLLTRCLRMLLSLQEQ